MVLRSAIPGREDHAYPIYRSTSQEAADLLATRLLLRRRSVHPATATPSGSGSEQRCERTMEAGSRNPHRSATLGYMYHYI